MKVILVLTVWICAISARPDRDAPRAIGGNSGVRTQQFLTVTRRQWSCANSFCEETVTKCTNNVCDSTKNKFKAESYQPEIPEIVLPPLDLQAIKEAFKLPPIPSISLETPFDNSGSIDLVSNNDNFTYYWSNSKQYHKTCENKICVVTTKTCSNGVCEEKTEQEKF